MNLTCNYAVTYNRAVDEVFKALADGNRRRLLNILRERNGQSLADLCSCFRMSRQAVMKHLRILEKANLLVIRRNGRAKLHYLNPAPMRKTYGRWISAFQIHSPEARESLKSKLGYPERIICLTDETTEVLYLLGEEDRIAGISGFTVRPPGARKEKNIVSAFTSANIEKILDLRPDLVFGFSDLQADILKELAGRGLQVHVFNQRSVDGILNMIRSVGAMVGAAKNSEILIGNLKKRMDRIKTRADKLIHRPVVYFEEWDEPLITGIGWVSELIEIAGGIDCFKDLARNPLARDRVIRSSGEVVRRKPDIIIGSWCGKKFRPDDVRNRKDWDGIPAVQNGHIYEIKSSDILQPGPAALTDGLDQIHKLICRVQSRKEDSRSLHKMQK